jgi:GNAT superfamily N-acetyltransferase
MIVRFEKTLTEPPRIPQARLLGLANFSGSRDIDDWLEIRDEAFHDLTRAGRPWTRDDFAREFIAQPWWTPERMWLVRSVESEGAVGTVTLASPMATHPERVPVSQTGGQQSAGVAGRSRTSTDGVIKWLAVKPAWQRRGVGRLLVTVAEQRAWSLGYRRLRLETLQEWAGAVEFYKALGYRAQ